MLLKKSKNIIIVLLLVAAVLTIYAYYSTSSPAEAADQVHQRVDTFTSSGTFTVPSGVTSVTFEAWGGGGGGSTNAGAGGGGAFMKKVQSVSGGAEYTVTVGSGGSAGGSDGGDTRVTPTSFPADIILAPGGNGGGTNGGAGGLASNGTGDSGFDGGDGQQGTGTRVGGGGAGTTENGIDGGAGGSGTGEGGAYFGGLSPSNASANNDWYGSGGGSGSSAQRSGADGVVMATYDEDIGSGYPVIKSRGFGFTDSVSDAQIHPIVMPSGIQEGDLILLVFSSNGAPSFSNYTEAGWTLLDEATQAAFNTTGGIFYVVATSTTPGLTLNTSAGEATTHMTFRIANAGTPISASSTGFSANINPPSLDTGSSAKYLWIATAARDGSSTGRVSAPPSGYEDFIYMSNPIKQANSTDTAVATLHSETQTEDPGTFTSESQEWVSFTIAIPFSGADAGGPGDSIDTVKTLIKGGATFEGGVTFNLLLPFFQSFFTFASLF